MARRGIYLPWCLPTATGEYLHLLQSRPQQRHNLGEKEPIPKGNSARLHQGRVGEPGLVLIRKSGGGVLPAGGRRGWRGQEAQGEQEALAQGRNKLGAPHLMDTCVSLCSHPHAFPAPGTSTFFFPRDKTMLTQTEGFCILAQLPSTLLIVTPSPGNLAWLLQHSHLNASQPVPLYTPSRGGECVGIFFIISPLPWDWREENPDPEGRMEERRMGMGKNKPFL